MSNYLMPPMWDAKGDLTPEDRKTGWLREAIQEGTGYLKSQRAWPEIDRAIELLYGPDANERRPRSLSSVYVNRFERQAREIIATLSNIRMIGAFKTDNREFDEQGFVLNKSTEAWWYNTSARASLREALQYAGIEGTGYGMPIWERDYWVTGRGDIQVHTCGAKDVIPIQLPKDHNLQRAYAAVLRTEAPINLARSMYPHLADKIKPDREQPGWYRRGIRKVQRFLSPALNVADNDRDREVTCPTVDIWNTYVLDLTVNNTGRVIPMGKPGSNWYYEVPYIGQDIPSGIRNTAGQMLYRKALWEDCLLYPMRRLFVGIGERAPIEVSDDSSPWWHGKVPAVKFTLDDWPWEYLGLSLAHHPASIQASIAKLLRVIDDSANAKLRPYLMWQSSSGLSQSGMDQLDTRQPGGKVEVDLGMGRPIETLLPPDYYNVTADIWKHIEHLEESQDFVLAYRDMAALARARQLPAGDTMEKLFELLGPIPEDQSETMGRSIHELFEMVKCLEFQFYTTKRRVQILGERGVVDQDYDYDPANMIPARNSDEAMEAYFRRVRRHTDNFIYRTVPGELHKITQMTRQLSMMQLFIRGFPIDPWTMAEGMDLPNFGPPPEGTKNMIERWVAWMRMRGELMADIQTEAAQKMAAAQQAANPLSALDGLLSGNPPGRPPSGNAPPKLASKDGGTRSTITESR